MIAIKEYLENKNNENTTNQKSWDMTKAIFKGHINQERGNNDNAPRSRSSRATNSYMG